MCEHFQAMNCFSIQTKSWSWERKRKKKITILFLSLCAFWKYCTKKLSFINFSYALLHSSSTKPCLQSKHTVEECTAIVLPKSLPPKGQLAESTSNSKNLLLKSTDEPQIAGKKENTQQDCRWQTTKPVRAGLWLNSTFTECGLTPLIQSCQNFDE